MEVHRDRTTEFFRIASNLKGQQVKSRNTQKYNDDLENIKNPKVKQTIIVNRMAAEITRDINSAASKLDSLFTLAQSNVLFNDPGPRIKELTFLVKKDLATIGKKINRLDETVKTRDLPNDQTKVYSETLVGALQSILHTTTLKFTEALETRTKNLKSHEERREKVTGTRRFGNSPIFQPAVNMYDLSNDDISDELSITIPIMDMQEDLYVDRRNAIMEIEKSIYEVKEMFQKVAQLVHVQNEQIQRLEDNIDETLHHAQSAHGNLVGYFPQVASNRRLIIQTFAVLFFFVVLWFLFFV